MQEHSKKPKQHAVQKEKKLSNGNKLNATRKETARDDTNTINTVC